ncbi:helix-turn-helix domain-containing protein [Streptobacillus notomytis]|uniref:helix-turn-helix domain-containing protein n=1 Tax=Streptobacillus notomytis TaxID=1712031 RepID=UPI000832ECEE|nr:helix-turn-helix transcriptional regulator [Streptobacillus notomytis]
MITTGEIISKYLEIKNINQIFLAKSVEITPQYINGIIKNKRSASQKVIDKIIKFLKISETDVDMIKKYEIFRKTGLIKKEAINIKVEAKYTDYGYITEYEEGLVILEQFGNIYSNSYILKIETYNLRHFIFGDYVVIKKENKELTEYLNKYFLVKFNDEIDFCKLEKIDDKLLLTYLNKNKAKKIIRLNKKIDIIGTIIGKYSPWKEEDE